jgi:hypothetical protein
VRTGLGSFTDISVGWCRTEDDVVPVGSWEASANGHDYAYAVDIWYFYSNISGVQTAPASAPEFATTVSGQVFAWLDAAERVHGSVKP